ncbi:uncharacterized protein VTP21DRAFT_8664 [Calcarisporiella thermophila]|uniref:uncharacterized protein n=1 Tax=Calcarisporiella thermophila TaxID=911321 RepID=UPI0037424DD6
MINRAPAIPLRAYGITFGIGVVMGGLIEYGLIKANYYDMLTAYEAKQRAKELEDFEEGKQRIEKMKANNSQE